MIAPIQAECVLTVARTGSFRRAASELELSQPTVSGHVAKLERICKVRIFERNGSGTKLTSDGEQLVPHLRAFLTSQEIVIRESQRIAHTDMAQHVTIAAFRLAVIAMLPPVLRIMRGAVPRARVDVLQVDEAESVRLVRDGEADLGLSFRQTSSSLDEPDLIERVVLETHIVAYAHEHHRFAEMDSIPTSEFEGEALILFPSPLTMRRVDEELAGVPNITVIRAPDEQAAVAMAAEGVGIAFGFPALAAISAPGIIARPLAAPELFSATVLRHRQRPLDPAASIAWELLTNSA